MKFEGIDQVKSFVNENKVHPKWIKEAREEHKDLKALVYGDNYKDLIIQIEHLEVKKRIDARRKYSRSIQGLNQRLFRTLDNVFCATGGNKEYPGIQDKSEDDRKSFMSKITHVRDNKSIENFLQTYWVKDLQVVDPSGLLMLEFKGRDLDKLIPTYKSIDLIRTYKPKGQLIEFVYFEPFKITKDKFEEKYQIKIPTVSDTDIIEIHRVVDDEMDWNLVKVNDIFLDIDLSFENPFGVVPAMTNSSRIRLGLERKFSFIHDIIGDQKEFLRDQSVKTLFKYKNGFPIPYGPKLVCPSCKGRKKDGNNVCPECGGKGEIMTRDVIDEINFYIDLDSDGTINIPSNFAGYINPPIEIWDQYNKEHEGMEDDMNFVLYGSHLTPLANETATGRFIDQQPVSNSLHPVSDTAQFMEYMFTEWIANFIFIAKDKKEPVSIIQYGRRYLLEPPDSILNKLENAIEKEMPDVIKTRLLEEYLTSKYKNDVVTLKEELLKKEVEPYIFYPVDKVNSIFGNTEARKKMLFNDFWETLTVKDKKNDQKKLKEMFDVWFEENNLEETPPPQPQQIIENSINQQQE